MVNNKSVPKSKSAGPESGHVSASSDISGIPPLVLDEGSADDRPKPPCGFFLSHQYCLSGEFTEEQHWFLKLQLPFFKLRAVNNNLQDYMLPIYTDWFERWSAMSAEDCLQRHQEIIQLLVMKAEQQWAESYPPGVTLVNEVMALLDCLHGMIKRLCHGQI